MGCTDSTASRRVICHFDLDCFYAQVEEQRRPELRARPLGITQKFLVVTTNYVARKLGVPKMVSIKDAREKCPDLVLINGEDLTPYRDASRRIMGVLRRFGVLEKRGLDEAVVDLTDEVAARMAAGFRIPAFVGFVHGQAESSGPPQEQGACDDGEERLKVGSVVAAEARAALEAETGYRCSCGIADSKMLAKMACSLHKPNGQTSMPSRVVLEYIAALPLRKLPGVGHRMEERLAALKCAVVADLRALPPPALDKEFGARIGEFLYGACRGIDATPVVDKGPPKSLSVEDSFRVCNTYRQAQAVVKALSPDLVSRLDEDFSETERTPKTFTLKWRTKGGPYSFTSTSCGMPADLVCRAAPMERRTLAAERAAMRLLARAWGDRPFALVVLNIGATNFAPPSGTDADHGAGIRAFLGVAQGMDAVTDGPPVPASSEDSGSGEARTSRGAASLTSSPRAVVTSKREARIQREQIEAVRRATGGCSAAEAGQGGDRSGSCKRGLPEQSTFADCLWPAGGWGDLGRAGGDLRGGQDAEMSVCARGHGSKGSLGPGVVEDSDEEGDGRETWVDLQSLLARPSASSLPGAASLPASKRLKLVSPIFPVRPWALSSGPSGVDSGRQLSTSPPASPPPPASGSRHAPGDGSLSRQSQKGWDWRRAPEAGPEGQLPGQLLLSEAPSHRGADCRVGVSEGCRDLCAEVALWGGGASCEGSLPSEGLPPGSALDPEPGPGAGLPTAAVASPLPPQSLADEAFQPRQAALSWEHPHGEASTAPALRSGPDIAEDGSDSKPGLLAPSGCPGGLLPGGNEGPHSQGGSQPSQVSLTAWMEGTPKGCAAAVVAGPPPVAATPPTDPPSAAAPPELEEHRNSASKNVPCSGPKGLAPRAGGDGCALMDDAGAGDGFVECAACGGRVRNLKQALQEHSDYHLARRLHEEEVSGGAGWPQVVVGSEVAAPLLSEQAVAPRSSLPKGVPGRPKSAASRRVGWSGAAAGRGRNPRSNTLERYLVGNAPLGGSRVQILKGAAAVRGSSSPS